MVKKWAALLLANLPAMAIAAVIIFAALRLAGWGSVDAAWQRWDDSVKVALGPVKARHDSAQQAADSLIVSLVRDTARLARESEGHAAEARRLRCERREAPALPDTATASDSASWWQQRTATAVNEAERWRLAYVAADSGRKVALAAFALSESGRSRALTRVLELEGLLADRPEPKNRWWAVVLGAGVGADGKVQPELAVGVRLF